MTLHNSFDLPTTGQVGNDGASGRNPRTLSTVFSSSSLGSACELVGNSEAMLAVQEIIQRVAASDGTVLIHGETGTGKELVARAIHRMSARSGYSLVSVNCASIPDTLFESELFGYERGAFTGAAQRHDGLLRAANGGTLFLDEIGEMSALAQAKILRAIEDGEVRPLGAQRAIKLNVRIIAATHRDLSALVRNNTFRADLFFRLNVVPIHLPALRERQEDIPDLVHYFIDEFNTRHRRKINRVTPAAMRFLCEEEWPGNIRQLRNAIEAAFILFGDNTAELDLRSFSWNRTEIPALKQVITSRSIPRECLDSGKLLSALQVTHWNKTKAAELLQCSRMTVYRKIHTYRLSPDDRASDSV
jgi:transcriptional regulator with PAS, ATPase and Fis domain